MTEKITGDLGGGSRLSRFEPAFRAASTKRRMAKKRYVAEIEGARDLRAPPSIGPSVLFRDHSPRPGGRPLGGQTSAFAAK